MSAACQLPASPNSPNRLAEELWGSFYSPTGESSSKDSSPLSSPFSHCSSGESVFSSSSTEIEDILKSPDSGYDSGLGFDTEYFLNPDCPFYNGNSTLSEISFMDSTAFFSTPQCDQSAQQSVCHTAASPQISPLLIQATPIMTPSTSLPTVSCQKLPSPAAMTHQQSGFHENSNGAKRVRLSPKPYPDSKPNGVIVNGSGENHSLQKMELKLVNSTLVLVTATTSSEPQQIPLSLPVSQTPMLKEVKQESIPENISMMSPAEVNAWRRRQRAIKNREAASISRTKKKEYVQSLEAKLKEMSEENEQLKKENEHLKGYVEMLKIENDLLKCTETTEPLTHSGYKPQSLPGSLFTNVGAKAAICLMVMGFFCVFNFGTIKYLQPANFQKVGIEKLVDRRFTTGEKYHIRSLLSVDENSPDFESATLAVPQRNGSRVGLNETVDPSCGYAINATESLRLVDELKSWVKRHERLVNSDRKKQKLPDRLWKSEEKKVPKKEGQRGAKRHKLGEIVRNKPTDTPWWFENDLIATDVRFHYARRPTVGDGSLKVYENDEIRKYYKFLEALQRRDDTFYVVSFKRDYILLPALAHNKTVRPRMSLVMPAFPVNESMQNSPFDFSMMQIDCEVVGTSLIQFPEAVVPSHLKNQGSANSTAQDIKLKGK